MSTPLIPQEIYLLERYTSLEYFGRVRDAWDEVVRHVETCLELFVNKLPADYRSRPLYAQPDIVWGERVLPNFYFTRDQLNSSYIEVSHGIKQSLGAAGYIVSDVRGQSDSSTAWFNEPGVAREIPDAMEKYYDLLFAAKRPAFNINLTVAAGWNKDSLGRNYSSESRGPLNPPEGWPKYRLNPEVMTETGEKAPQTGLYLPLVDEAAPQFLIEGNQIYEAYVGLIDDGGAYREELPSRWVLVERIPDEYVGDGLVDLLGGAEVRIERVPAGQPCPRTGWWYTPAKFDSRRHFKHGEPLPAIENTDYGSTFWLWSPDQG